MTFKHVVVGTAVLLMSSLAMASVKKTGWGKSADGQPVRRAGAWLHLSFHRNVIVLPLRVRWKRQVLIPSVSIPGHGLLCH